MPGQPNTRVLPPAPVPEAAGAAGGSRGGDGRPRPWRSSPSPRTVLPACSDPTRHGLTGQTDRCPRHLTCGQHPPGVQAGCLSAWLSELSGGRWPLSLMARAGWSTLWSCAGTPSQLSPQTPPSCGPGDKPSLGRCRHAPGLPCHVGPRHPECGFGFRALGPGIPVSVGAGWRLLLPFDLPTTGGRCPGRPLRCSWAPGLSVAESPRGWTGGRR